jgi:tetratricopeptide (TPR) repeat protein
MNTPSPISTALQYQRSGRVAEAEQVYKLLLKEQPHSIDALNLLGALVYDDKRFSEAEEYFAKVLMLQPGAESHNSMGIVLKAQGKYEEAVEHYQQALALKPNQPEVLSNLGNVLKETGKLEAAIAAYQQALAINPNYAEAHNNLGIVYKEQHDLEAAIACYQTAIQLKPTYPEAHHNLGMVLRLQNKLDEAIAYFQQAIAFKPTYAEAYISLASTLQQQDKLDDAIAQYQRLIEIKPDSADGFNNLGLALQQQKRLEEAIAAFEQALKLRPDFPGVRNNLGNLFLENDRLEQAIASYEQAIEDRPNYPEAINNLGNALQQKGDLDGAIVQYRKALEYRPTFVEALSNLGAVLKDQHKVEEAVSCLEQAIALNPNIAEIHNNLGNVYQEQKQIEAAIEHYRQALALKPEMVEVRSNLGNMLQYVGEFEEAFAHFEAAIAAQPDFAGAYNNLGIAYRNSGRVQDAFASYDRAIGLKPDFVEAHWNKALNDLLIGDFERGFAGYEWRFQWSRFLSQNPARSYDQPRWDGSDLHGKVILLYAEQGIGDTIQFIRYLPMVKAQGGRIVVECHPPLHNLFQQFPEIDQLIPLGAIFSTGFDVHAPLMSLPHILGTTLETVPAQVPYLKAPNLDPSVLEKNGDLALSNASFKIGIVWDGNPQNPYNRLRAVPLADVLHLAEIPGVTLYSLQKEPKPEDLELLQQHPEVVDWRSHLNDFTDTATLIDQLDLVISIDTAVTHLAGALGKPTWLLLPLAPDWRWMCDRSDSPWYPTLRLFRQPAFGDWASVLAEVRRTLEEQLGVKRQEAGCDVSAQPNGGRRQEAGGRRQEREGTGERGNGKKRKKSRGKTEPSPSRILTPSLPNPQPPTPNPQTPKVPPAALQTVIKLHQAGRVPEARQACVAYLETEPNSADGWHLMGLMAHYERQLDAAIAHYRRALQADTNHLDTYNNLAVALHEQGKIEEAMPYYQKAIALNPQGADAHNNYANALRDRGRLEDAIEHYHQAIAARPAYADAYNNLGLAYYNQGDFERAATAYRQAIDRRPNFPQALNHLGNALKELGHFAEASQYYQQAIALKPDYAKAYNNWGNVFRDSGDLQTAVQYYDQATAIEPNFAEAHWNKALTLLLGGDLQRGFEEYEWRKHVNLPSFRSLRDFPGPRWQGEPLNGQLIYLHAEQGMGDIIQFVRYVPWVVQRGGRVILECHPPLMNLLSGMPGVEQRVPYGSPPPAYQIQAPLLSLAHIFQSTAETLPATVPYLHPPASTVALPPPATPALKVGFVWSGNPDNPYNRSRAIPPDFLLPLAELPGIALYSLQKDLQPGEAELLSTHPQVHDLRSQMTDFVDTAALIQQLDLVISIDTSVTHLAGALGKPVWLLLPFAPDWRWMLHRDDSPWYPTLRIFRQSVQGNWEPVLQQVREELVKAGSKQEAGGRGQEAGGGRQELNSFPSPQPLARSAELDSAKLIVEATSKPSPSPTPHPSLPTPSSPTPSLLAIAFQSYQSGNLAEAERVYRQVLQQEPDQPDALHVLSVILCQTKQFEEATTIIRRLVALQPEFADGWRNLGGVLQEQKQFEAAIAPYQRALELDPNNPDLHQNLSTVLLELDRPFEALTHAQRLVALKPHSADAQYNLGYTLRRAGQVEAAIACYRQAIALSPDMAMAHKNLGHALLLLGDFVPGFQEIEWRWQQPGWARRPLTQPEWDGSDLTGKTILLYAEQGLGDTLQFIRYVPLVKARGGQVIVECQADLMPLLAQLPECDRWVPQESPLPAFDVHAPLMSLPRILGTTVETVPVRIPYIAAGVRRQKAEEIKFPSPTSLTSLTSPLPTPHSLLPIKVGIVWAGNPGHRNDRLRSCGLEAFRPVFEVANVRFVSLQKGAAAQQLQDDPECPVADWSDRLETFVDTAAAIAELDLVITVDTAVAHLAGAMGKPVWVVLMFAADWRWMVGRDDTPWYPTMRLFRQTSPGDWAGVFARVQEELVKAGKRPEAGSRRPEGEGGGVGLSRKSPNAQLRTQNPPLQETTVAFSWPLDDRTDWGILGTQWALHLLQQSRFQPVLMQPLNAESQTNPLLRSRLRTLPVVSAETFNGITLALLNDATLPYFTVPNPATTIVLVGLKQTHLEPEIIAQLQHCRAIAVGSTWGAAQLKRMGLDAVILPLYGVDPLLLNVRGKTGLLSDRYVIFSNADTFARGQDILIAAFQQFHAQHSEAFLVLAGTETAVWQQAKLLPEVGCLIPAIAAPLMGQILPEVDVAVFPSRCETGVNQAIAASLAAGIPTVLANNTANKDLIQHNLGFPLNAQRPVKSDTIPDLHRGWGESDVEEIVEILEYLYTQRQEAQNRGAIAAEFMRQYLWEHQISNLMTLCNGT